MSRMLSVFAMIVGSLVLDRPHAAAPTLPKDNVRVGLSVHVVEAIRITEAFLLLDAEFHHAANETED